MSTQTQELLVDLIQETLSPDGLYSSYVFEKDYIEGVLGIQIPLNESYPYSNELRIRILEEEGKIRGFFSSLKQTAKDGWDLAMTMREACKDKASIEKYTNMAITRMRPKMKTCLSWLKYVEEIDKKVEPPAELKKKVGSGGGSSGLSAIYKPLLKSLPALDKKVDSADGWRRVIWSTMALVSVEFVHEKIQGVGLDVLETAIDEFNVVAKEQGVDPIKKGQKNESIFLGKKKLILEAAGEAAKKAWIALYELVKKWSGGILKWLAQVVAAEFARAKLSAGIANVISWMDTAFDGMKFVIDTLRPLMGQFKDWVKNKKSEISDALSGVNDPTVAAGQKGQTKPQKKEPIKFEVVKPMILRKLIREILEQEVGQSSLPKGEWLLLEPGDLRREEVKNSLYDMVQQTYEPIGGHFKISSPDSLDRYTYWVVKDIDDDPDVDVAILGKPDISGQKMGAAANDGTPAASAEYKNKSAELRAGGSIGGVGNWWGEVSGKPAYAMLKRGARAVEDEAKVAELLAGDDYIFHGEHPDPNAPPLFKSARGWYTKKFGSKSSTKIILGNPS